MSLSTLDYLNLSALAYIDFGESAKGKTIEDLISKEIIPKKDLANPELSALQSTSNPLRSYTLINAQLNTASGFTAAAFNSYVN